MSDRNHLYLRSQLAHLGLQRGDVAKMMGVEGRTVSHWLSGRNGIPEALWRKLATIEERIEVTVQAVIKRWDHAGRPLVWAVTIPEHEPQGPHYVAAWEALERFAKAGVHVTLKRPVTEDHK